MIDSFKQFLSGEILMETKQHPNERAKDEFKDFGGEEVEHSEPNHKAQYAPDADEPEYAIHHGGDVYSHTTLSDYYNEDDEKWFAPPQSEIKNHVAKDNPHLSDEHVKSATRIIHKHQRKWTKEMNEND